jgi:hypothetical protein
MSRIYKHQRDIRLFIFILLLISFFGPWFFDTLYIPSEYPCSIRLRENICGTPVLGLWIILAGIGVFSSLILELFRGAAITHSLVRNLYAGCLLLSLVLPFFSMLLMIIIRDRRSRLAFHMLACSIALSAGLFIAINEDYSKFWLLWGIWLYVGAIASALILEVIVLMAKRRRPLLVDNHGEPSLTGAS